MKLTKAIEAIIDELDERRVEAQYNPYPFKRFGEFGSYLANMPVIDTDQFAGRCHKCPLCGAYVWSCWANARKHWEKHEREHLAARKAIGKYPTSDVGY